MAKVVIIIIYTIILYIDSILIMPLSLNMLYSGAKAALSLAEASYSRRHFRPLSGHSQYISRSHAIMPMQMYAFQHEIVVANDTEVMTDPGQLDR